MSDAKFHLWAASFKLRDDPAAHHLLCELYARELVKEQGLHPVLLIDRAASTKAGFPPLLGKLEDLLTK